MTERHKRSGDAAHGVDAAYHGYPEHDEARTTQSELRKPKAAAPRLEPSRGEPIGDAAHREFVRWLYGGSDE